ncbi:hypothetical protein J2W50_004822 [Herbaspirillum frisingense]|uniref:Uncharacterized protein n=1 Tax=Herbaspirillum frisingense TaxID=92645 RepID=A0ABU1PKY2_9BURK|nr:hypothetical protein [Herbaspirillum frisingense]
MTIPPLDGLAGCPARVATDAVAGVAALAGMMVGNGVSSG